MTDYICQCRDTGGPVVRGAYIICTELRPLGVLEHYGSDFEFQCRHDSNSWL